MNRDAGGDFIYLLYKTDSNADDINYGFITDFYIKQGACRAHFVVPTTKSGARAMTHVVANYGDDETTEITPVNNANSDDAWYSLDSRRLSGQPTKRGVYIHNNKKVVIK